MPFTIAPLFEHPQHRRQIATLIHEEFWVGMPGASVDAMDRRLAAAQSPDRLPLSLIALAGDVPIGVVNLVDNDDERHPEWHPWLAGMVVAEPWRGRGVGTALVQALLAQAGALGFETVYFGTDGPRFYQRLGAVIHHEPRPGFWFMRFHLRTPGAGAA